MGLPKVLVFTCIYDKKDYCLERFVEHTKKLTYENKTHIFIDNTNDDGKYLQRLRDLGLTAYKVPRGGNSRAALANSQNFARQIAIDEGYDYLFSLESDIFTPYNVIDVLLLQTKDVVTGLYHIGDRDRGQRVPCITMRKWNSELGAYGTRMLAVEEWEDYLNKGMKQVAAGGFGCCLISKRIFKKVSFYYHKELKGHSDIFFFNKLFNLRILYGFILT